ncbi:MAG: hypothetical protein N2C14_00300, partial [Planctomycetales bacterium]
MSDSQASAHPTSGGFAASDMFPAWVKLARDELRQGRDEYAVLKMLHRSGLSETDARVVLDEAMSPGEDNSESDPVFDFLLAIFGCGLVLAAAVGVHILGPRIDGLTFLLAYGGTFVALAMAAWLLARDKPPSSMYPLLALVTFEGVGMIRMHFASRLGMQRFGVLLLMMGLGGVVFYSMMAAFGGWEIHDNRNRNRHDGRYGCGGGGGG